MRIVRNVYWGQGSFLTPQHMQRADEVQAAARGFLWRVAQPHGWGLETLQLDEQALLRGQVEVQRCALVMHDGTVLAGGSEWPRGNARFESRWLGGASTANARATGLYFAISRATHVSDRSAATPQAFTGSGALPARHRLDDEPLHNLYDSRASVVEVTGVQTVMSIVADSDEAFDVVRQGADIVRFAEIQGTSATGFKLVREHIAPSLNVGASPALLDIASRVRAQLFNRYDILSSARQGTSAAVGAMSTADLTRTIMLQTLGRAMPPLDAALADRAASPHGLYLQLRQLIADLGALSEGFDALGDDEGHCRPFPAYDHDRLRECLAPLVTVIERALDRLVAAPLAGYALTHDGQYFGTTIPRDVLDDPMRRYFLVVNSALPRQELHDKLQALGKMGARDIMQRLAASNTPGLALKTPASTPAEVPRPSANLTVFEIAAEGSLWARVLQSGAFAIYTPLQPSQVTFRLYAVTGRP